MSNPVSCLGRYAQELCLSVWNIFALFFQTLYWMLIGPFLGKASRRGSIFEQMVFVGVKSLIIIFFVNFFIGIVLAMQSAYQLSQLGAEVYAAALVSVSMCRELGPVMTGLVIAGRVGAAITAEIGTMKVGEQLEALQAMALNPVRFLVVPRFLALLIMLPLLTIVADASGIFGGYLVGTTSLNINPGLYLDTSFMFLEFKDIFTGLFKSAVFGMIIALIACHQGLTTSGGAAGVGKSTTKSVVISFILVILADVIITGIFYFAKV